LLAQLRALLIAHVGEQAAAATRSAESVAASGAASGTVLTKRDNHGPVGCATALPARARFGLVLAQGDGVLPSVLAERRIRGTDSEQPVSVRFAAQRNELRFTASEVFHDRHSLVRDAHHADHGDAVRRWSLR
jgi:hypothetical protein